MLLAWGGRNFIVKRCFRIFARSNRGDWRGGVGIPILKVGTHSLRSVAAMATFLESMPIFLIMMIGRWSNDGFLKQFRKQVLESSRDIYFHVLKNDLHHVLPSPSSTIDNLRIRSMNPFVSNFSSVVITSIQIQTMRPSFSLYHYHVW